jgi:hypothetical protein
MCNFTHVQHLASHDFLRHLLLTDCDIGDDGIVALAEALKTNTSVRSLALDGNRITDKGLSHLVDMLAVGGAIERPCACDVHFCSLHSTPANLTTITMQLLFTTHTQVNFNIDVLRLRNNKLTTAGVVALVDSLPTAKAVGGAKVCVLESVNVTILEAHQCDIIA